MNLFQKFLGKTDTAVSKWRSHYESVKGGQDRTDREAVERNAKLLEELEKCRAEFAQSEQDMAAWRRLSDAQSAYNRDCAAFNHWAEGSARGEGRDRLERHLNEGLLRDAISEARREIEDKHRAALASVEKLVEETGIPADAQKAEIERRFKGRLTELYYADLALKNIAVTDRTVHPRGKIPAHQHLETALQP
jgi:hypothetical protein